MSRHYHLEISVILKSLRSLIGPIVRLAIVENIRSNRCNYHLSIISLFMRNLKRRSQIQNIPRQTWWEEFLSPISEMGGKTHPYISRKNSLLQLKRQHIILKEHIDRQIRLVECSILTWFIVFTFNTSIDWKHNNWEIMKCKEHVYWLANACICKETSSSSLKWRA